MRVSSGNTHFLVKIDLSITMETAIKISLQSNLYVETYKTEIAELKIKAWVTSSSFYAAPTLRFPKTYKSWHF